MESGLFISEAKSFAESLNRRFVQAEPGLSGFVPQGAVNARRYLTERVLNRIL